MKDCREGRLNSPTNSGARTGAVGFVERLVHERIQSPASELVKAVAQESDVDERHPSQPVPDPIAWAPSCRASSPAVVAIGVPFDLASRSSTGIESAQNELEEIDMKPAVSRRSFLYSLGGAGLATTLAARPADASGAGKAATNATAPLNAKACNPLRRTPLSLIIDDSCPVINKAYYWIQQMHEWRLRHRPDSKPSGWEVHYDKLDRMPNTIPAAHAARWGEWCAEQGIRGKFSLVPFPSI